MDRERIWQAGGEQVLEQLLVKYAGIRVGLERGLQGAGLVCKGLVKKCVPKARSKVCLGCRQVDGQRAREKGGKQVDQKHWGVGV